MYLSLIFCPEIKNQTLEAIEKRLHNGAKLRNLGAH